MKISGMFTTKTYDRMYASTWNTREDFINAGFIFYVDGKPALDDYQKEDLENGLLDDCNIQLMSTHRKKLHAIKPSIATTKHPKGILKECKYYIWRSTSWHKLLYIWFYQDYIKGMDIGHLDSNSLNNKLSNLKMMTRKENLAMRRGAINQYGLRLKDREENKQ